MFSLIRATLIVDGCNRSLYDWIVKNEWFFEALASILWLLYLITVHIYFVVIHNVIWVVWRKLSPYLKCLIHSCIKASRTMKRFLLRLADSLLNCLPKRDKAKPHKVFDNVVILPKWHMDSFSACIYTFVSVIQNIMAMTKALQIKITCQ